MGGPRNFDNSVEYQCHNCGVFSLSGSADVSVASAGYTLAERAKLSHGLRRMGGSKLLTTYSLDAIIRDTTLPDASALRDNLLLHVQSELAGPGESMDLWAPAVCGWLGALSPNSARWAIEQAMAAHLLQGIPARAMNAEDYIVANATLTVHGWARVEELLREAKDSKKAFMAMKFGDPNLDEIFRNHFKPAVLKAGFDLVRLDDEPRAGLIDDRLRLEIRTSRFMVADLSHANAGAYWEAGFAEGLGRPVIYTCHKDVFDDPKTKPHFDTNHYLTVVWDPKNPAAAAEQLKTVIRVTLPTEALLADTVEGPLGA